MENKLQIFEKKEFGQLRTVEIKGEIYFVATDVCKILEIKNHRDAVSRLDEDEKADVGITDTSSNGVTQKRKVLCVNEAGLYCLIFKSRKPEAKQFQRWIYHEVIPAIHEHGLYATPSTIDKIISNPEFGIKLLTALKQEREEKKQLAETVAVQTQQIEELTPKAKYYDIILNCKDLVAISTIAKDYGWSAQKMNSYLQDKGIQYKLGNIWLLYQKYASSGYTSTKTHMYKNDDETHLKVHTYWTQKGRLFIYNLLKSEKILPLIEKQK